MADQHDMAITRRATFSQISHPRFAAFYDRFARWGPSRRFTDPLREETAGQAYGVILEVGVGTGLNFSFYHPERVKGVEAVEPDAAMLAYARGWVSQAHVPITFTQASVEALPFADAAFDSAVVSLVFCSVDDPDVGMQEIARVLKSQGSLFLFEHVRAPKPFLASLQDTLVPVTTHLFGQCHWNRDTKRTVREAGFQIIHLRHLGGGIQPIIVLQARRS